MTEQMRAVGIAALTAFAIVGCGHPSVPLPTTLAAAGASAASVVLSDFKITPPALTMSGPMVRITVRNDGALSHDLYVGDASGGVLLRTRTLAPGETETIRGVLAPGTYTTYCALPGHEDLGMKGTLTVS